MRKRSNIRDEESDSDTENKTIAPSGSANLEDYPLSASTIKNLKEKGIVSLFPIQIACFHPIYEGKDLIGRDRTGSGKTLAFALPILEKLREKEKFKQKAGQRPYKIVIVPTRELAIQVSNEYERFKNTPNEYRVVTCYGGTELYSQIDTIKRGCEIVVGTPGRLIDLMERKVLALEKLKVFVLDETDQMLNLGFQEDIDKILKFVKDDFEKEKKDVSEIQYLLFSATIPKWVEKVSKTFMSKDHVRVDMIKGKTVKTSTTVEHLAIFFKSREDKIKAIGDVVQVYGGQHCRTIIFTDKKEEGNEVLLHGNLKIECQVLNGDIPQKQREVTFKSFKDGKVKCLIATNLASRGLDFPEVDLIVQLSPPAEIDTYIHRSGRTGRAGKSGKCVTFYLKRQQELVERIEVKANIKMRKVGAPQADEIMKANARDITNSLSQVNTEVITHFEENVENILKQYDPKEALARALAIISGYTKGIKRRSLLSGAEGCLTYVIETHYEIDRPSYFWGILRSNWSSAVVDSVKGLRMLESRKGCVFDVDDKFEQEIDGVAATLQARKLNVYQPKELPALDERQNTNSNGPSRSREPARNGFGNHRSNSQSNNKKDLKKLFVANIPFKAEEKDLKGVFEKKGYNVEDIFFLRNPDSTLKGFGYVRFSDEKEAGHALKELNGAKLQGKTLRMDYADERK